MDDPLRPVYENEDAAAAAPATKPVVAAGSGGAEKGGGSWFIQRLQHLTQSYSTSSQQQQSSFPFFPSRDASSFQRLTTPEELELIATETTSNGKQGGSSGSLLLVPTQGDMDEESSVESSLSTEDLVNDDSEDDDDDDNSSNETSSGEELVLLDPSLQTQVDNIYKDTGDHPPMDMASPSKAYARKFSFRMIRFARGSSCPRWNKPQTVTETITTTGTRTPPPPPQQQHRRQLLKEVDVEQYMAQREMTPLQERWNALTMIPNPIYCLYYLLAGLWVSNDLIQQVKSEAGTTWDSTFYDGQTAPSFGTFANYMMGDANGCLTPSSAWWGWPWHNMPALPPLPVVAVAFGICCHAPFSFLYHWKYAHTLPPGFARTNHWSRRMDQSMIHFASAFIAYATSGSWDFFVANALYNADCIYRQFKAKVRPRRNKIRITISILAYTIPILRRGDLLLFLKLWLVLGIGGWLFGKYPIGGWSHSAFHLVMALAPPLMMRAACDLPASQAQMKLAAYCVVLAEQQQQLAAATLTTTGII